MVKNSVEINQDNNNIIYNIVMTIVWASIIDDYLEQQSTKECYRWLTIFSILDQGRAPNLAR